MPSGPSPQLDLSNKQLTSLDEKHCEEKGKPWQTLVLSANQLTELPVFLSSKLASLKVVYINNNNLSKFPPELCLLRQLVKLHLESNRITTIPSSIENLRLLKKLYIQENELESLPSELGELSQLAVLNVSSNKLTTLPYQLVNLTSLTEFNVSNNPLVSPPLFVCNRGDWLWTSMYLRELAAAAKSGVPNEQYVFSKKVQFADDGLESSSISLSMKKQRKETPRNFKGHTRLLETSEGLSLNRNYLLYFLSDAASAGLQGNRPYMEDRHVVVPRLKQHMPESLIEEVENLFSKIGFYAIYDGHGGEAISEYLKRYLLPCLTNQKAFCEGRFADALRSAFAQADSTCIKWCLDKRKMDGSTSAVALVVDNKLISAHCGDSRTVLSRRKKAVRITQDHKPFRPDETERIRAAGGDVIHNGGCYRVNGQLAVSRSFGDILLKGKQLVISEPEVSVTELMPEDEMLIIASDGVWDAFTDQKAVDLCRKSTSAKDAAHRLCEQSIRKGSNDNVSAVVVFFRWSLDHINASGGSVPGKTIAEQLADEGMVEKSSMREKMTGDKDDDHVAPATSDAGSHTSQGYENSVVQVLVPASGKKEPFLQPVLDKFKVSDLELKLAQKHSLAPAEEYKLFLLNSSKALDKDVLLSSITLSNYELLVFRRESDPQPNYDPSNAADALDSSSAPISAAQFATLNPVNLETLRGIHRASVKLTAAPASQAVQYKGLPEGWGQTSTADGRVFYFNTQTKVTSWQRPLESSEQLPQGWRQGVSLLNKVYYYRRDTGESRWTLPA